MNTTYKILFILLALLPAALWAQSEQELSDSTKHLVKFHSKYWFWDFETKEFRGKLAF